jgi:NADH:ubiquinone oxidoreductase subunit F (NADH-binding)/(2Fe-2S) ferredoxin/NAD-dependent dihydropyrimidine dehydrogenase PreA subunit
MEQVLTRYEKIAKRIQGEFLQKQKENQIIIQIGSATCEKAAGADTVREEFEKLIKTSGRQDIVLKQTGCTGRCSREPIVGVFFPGQFPFKYEKVTVAKVQEIFNQHVQGGKPVLNMILDKKTTKYYSHVATLYYPNNADGIKWDEVFAERLKAKNLDPETTRIFRGGHVNLFTAGEKPGVGVVVFPEKTLYQFHSVEELDQIIQCHFVDNKICQALVAKTDPMTERFFSVYGDVAFFNRQTRLTLRNSGIIDPENLDEYIFNHGYEGLTKVLAKNDPQDVIEQVLKSGLRGRGGAGYPTARKWKDATTSPDTLRYIVCNADEGDPGAFMDRSALEGDPFSVIEGMTIGAFAIGAHQGYMYIRAEYPLAIERCEKAIALARAAGFLGKDILGSGFNFDVEIRLGAGAFVCGEETALIRSIEGRRGQPRIRPPYPTQGGLWGHPTAINNVETLANVPVIMVYGSEFFARIGTEKSKGTKVFALAGKINNTGLVEVPMGTTLREIVFDIGGGIPNGRSLKGVQTGGPSGGTLPASMLDTPIDYDSLTQAGTIMGSGGMIILDDSDCMVSNAKFFLEFTQDESCGKCVPCREGTLRMLEILNRITDGQAVVEDLDKLERLARLIQKTSLCGLGQNAPNPVLSLLKNFREEFLEHIREKHCPTQRCAKLIRYEIDPEKCTGCTLCARRCPVPCISGTTRKPHLIDQDRCIRCGECFKACKFDAVKKQ